MHGTAAARAVPIIEDIAQVAGLQHRYQVASPPISERFSIYQVAGGGVAVLDYDRDGNPDLYLAQGAAAPPTYLGDESNLLFRGLGDAVDDVTAWSATGDRGYSIGVTAGDWNQDGFPDLAVGNIGTDALLINNGDGTFSRRAIQDSTDRIPASLAMADLTGDQLPDLLEVCYVEDPDAARKPPLDSEGRVLQALRPTSFRGGRDRLLVGAPDGKFSAQPFPDAELPAQHGLGVVIGDFQDPPGSEVFVGNDLTANQFWVRNSGSRRWVDLAGTLGCAFSHTGGATASMGIAAADFDQNHEIDFHVTNYQQEESSLFQAEGGAFQDLNVRYQLAIPSKVVLGFGSQPIDYDNDGRIDLAVTNGHIERAVLIKAPFEQPAQLFRNVGGAFELATVRDASGYWNRMHVGRAMARLDFNRDGRNDLVITHLGEPTALLLNLTQTDQHWFQVRLVGVASERDAVGARIRLRCGDIEYAGWVLAGDGFLCRNEPLVCFGLGPQTQVDSLEIRWPSGSVQEASNLNVDQRLLIVEQQEPFVLSAEGGHGTR